jgi:hypothetical protein
MRNKTLNHIADSMAELLRLRGVGRVPLNPEDPFEIDALLTGLSPEKIEALRPRFLKAAMRAVTIAPESPWEFNAALAVVLGWPVLWIAWAWLARGGNSYRFAGIEVVRIDGRPAARWQFALRAALFWLPIVVLLLLSTALEAVLPGAPLLWWGLWWWALALLAFYIALALHHPAQSWHDRLVGTVLVPR